MVRRHERPGAARHPSAAREPFEGGRYLQTASEGEPQSHTTLKTEREEKKGQPEGQKYKYLLTTF